MHRRTPTVDLLAPFHVLRRGSAPAPAAGADPGKLSAFDPAFSPDHSASSSAAPIPLPASVSGISRVGSRRASAPKLSLFPTEPVPTNGHSAAKAQAGSGLAIATGSAATQLSSSSSSSPEKVATIPLPRAASARSSSATRSRPATVYAVTVKRKPVPKLEDLEADATFHRARRVSVSERSAPSLSRTSSSTGLSSSLPSDPVAPPPLPVTVFPVRDGWAAFGAAREAAAAARSSESDGESMRTCEEEWMDEGGPGMARTRSKAGSIRSSGGRSRRGSGHVVVHRQGRRASLQPRSLPPSPSLISVSFGKTSLTGHAPPPPRPARKGPRFEGSKELAAASPWETVASPVKDEAPVEIPTGRRQSAVSKHSRISSTGSAAEWCDALEQLPTSGRRPSKSAPFPQSVSDELPDPPMSSTFRSPSPFHEDIQEHESLPSDMFSSPTEFMTPPSQPSPSAGSSYPLLPPGGQARPRATRRSSVASSLASVGEGAESVEEDLLDAWMELMGPSGGELDPSARRHGRRGSERLKSISEDTGVPLSLAFPAAPGGSSAGSRTRRGSVFPSGPSPSSHDGHAEGAFGSPPRQDAGMYARSVASSVSLATGLGVDSPLESEPFHRERRLSSTASTFSHASSSALSGPGAHRKADPGATFFGGFTWAPAGAAAGATGKRATGLPTPASASASVALSSAWSDSRSHPASDASASASSQRAAVEPLRIRKTASGGVAPVNGDEMPPPVTARRGSGGGLMPNFLRRRSDMPSFPAVQPLKTSRAASVQGLVAMPAIQRSQASFDSATSSTGTAPAPTPRAREPREGGSVARPVSTFYSPFDSRSESLPPLFSHNKARSNSRQSFSQAGGSSHSRSASRQSAAPPVTGLPRIVGEGISPYARAERELELELEMGTGVGTGVTAEAEAEGEGPSAEWLANEKRRRSSAGLVTRSGPIKMGRLGSRTQGSAAGGMNEDVMAFLEAETRQILAA